MRQQKLLLIQLTVQMIGLLSNPVVDADLG
jgi:hypothetical protein